MATLAWCFSFKVSSAVPQLEKAKLQKYRDYIS